MKRYWRLISVGIIIVLSVGTFYIQSSLAGNKFPDFVLQKKSGDVEVTLEGNYQGRHINRNVRITAEGATYAEEYSFLDRIKGVPRDPNITRLQKDYRNFMRGKGNSIHMFAEDKDLLAYADMDYELSNDYQPMDYSLDVEVLDKRTKDKSSFTIPVSGNKKYNYLFVENVFVFNGQVKIITRNSFTGEDDTSEEIELHVYSFDVDKGKLVNDETLASGSEQNDTDGWVSISISVLSNDGIANLGKDIVVMKDTEKADRSLIRYNMETNEQEEIELPEELQSSNVESFNGTTLYFSKISGNQLEITSYDMESEQVEANQTFDLSNAGETGNLEEMFFTIEKDKLHIVIPEQNKKVRYSVVVAELSSGKVIYEGTVEEKGENTDQADSDLYIGNITVDGDTEDNE